MDRAEFDQFADEYQALHRANIKASGEGPEFFAEYKIRDLARWVRRLAPEQPRILDFGAGVGNSVPFFARYLPGAALTCLDVSPRSLDIARERFPGQADYRLFDGKRLPFDDGAFDVAFTACVFHHVPADEHVALMKELRRVLASGGFFVIFEHNPWNPLTARAVRDCPFDENAVLIDAPTLQRRLMAAGFRATRKRYRIFFPGFLKALRVCEPWLSWLPLGAQYYILART